MVLPQALSSLYACARQPNGPSAIVFRESRQCWRAQRQSARAVGLCGGPGGPSLRCHLQRVLSLSGRQCGHSLHSSVRLHVSHSVGSQLHCLLLPRSGRHCLCRRCASSPPAKLPRPWRHSHCPASWLQWQHCTAHSEVSLSACSWCCCWCCWCCWWSHRQITANSSSRSPKSPFPIHLLLWALLTYILFLIVSNLFKIHMFLQWLHFNNNFCYFKVANYSLWFVYQSMHFLSH